MSSPAKARLSVLGTVVHHVRLRAACLLIVLLLVPVLAAAGDSNLTELQRQQIIRVFLAEHPFVHRALPRGKAGVRIENGKITPSEAEMGQRVAEFGSVADPGDRARITAVRFDHHNIVFEINGGPAKRKKTLANHLSVGVNGIEPRVAPSQPGDGEYPDASGSSVLLVLQGDVASLTTDQIKQMLAPVLDFKAVNQTEAYEKSLPPILAQAVKTHHALVGMDKDMVIYTLGRPPRRIRETKDGHEYEEWIYGTPPHDVEFIRFLGETVVSIEDMKVTGEKIVRTQDEVGALRGPLNASAKDQPRPDAASAPEEVERSAPTLMRPGEKPPTASGAARDPNPAPPPDLGPPGQSDPTPPPSSVPR